MKNGVIDHVRRLFGKYLESLIKIRHDLGEKKFVARLGLDLGSGLTLGLGFKDDLSQIIYGQTKKKRHWGKKGKIY